MGSALGAEKSAAAKAGLSVEEWRRRRAAGERRCYHCSAWKGVEQFARDRSREGGRASICKPCNSARSTRSRYGLTREEDDALMAAAAQGCPICGCTTRELVVDHDHETGAVRARICGRCNVGMGLFDDDSTLMLRAVAYLQSHATG